MEVKSIEPSSKLNIYTSFSLSNDDVQTLSLLYAPLIGSDAFSLYMYFNSLLERNKLECESLTHKDLFTIFSLKPKTFLEARFKLEAVGLLRTYYSEEEYTKDVDGKTYEGVRYFSENVSWYMVYRLAEQKGCYKLYDVKQINHF